VISSNADTVWNRLPGEVGRNFFMPITNLPLIKLWNNGILE
jgi:hypothetical protein